ncbi:MAG: DUF4390 domain-containing protein [Steroidobacteraceae bacterium]
MRRTLRCLTRWMVLSWLAVAALAHAQAEEPRFGIRNAFVEPRGGVWQLNAILELGLSRAAENALSEGVPLTLILDTEVSRGRRFLPDENVAELQQRWQLGYDGLAQRYVVVNQNSGAQAAYASLGEALDALARIRELPLLDESLLQAGRRYEVSLRATLEIGGLPEAVKVLLFWREWSRVTDWYTWSVRP